MKLKNIVYLVLTFCLVQGAAFGIMSISRFGKLVKNAETSAPDIIKAYDDLNTLDKSDAQQLLKVFRKTTIEALKKSQEKPGPAVVPAKPSPEDDFDWDSALSHAKKRA